jgi:ABC-type sugar transport system ATPase subunit
VQQVGTTSEIYAQPANTFVATFVGTPQMNLYQGRIERTDAGLRFVGPVTARLTASQAARALPGGHEVTLGIRPEDVSLCGPAEPDAMPGIVDLVEAVGAESYVSVALGTEVVCTVRTSAKTPVSEGAPVHLAFPNEVLHFFDAQGSRLPLLMD